MNPTTIIWSKESLFNKSLLYSQEMHANTHDDWKFGLFSALSLELLIRSVLADISPILLADEKDWRNVYYATSGTILSKKGSPTSIGTTEALNRLKEIKPEITDELLGFCKQHINLRNTELHTGDIAFEKSKKAEWLPKYYKYSTILLNLLNKKIDDYFEDTKNVQQLIDSLADATAQAVQKDISAHKTVWENKSIEERNIAISRANTWAVRQSGHCVVCPSCNSKALLYGSPSGPVNTVINNDEVIQKQTMYPSSFECIACGLKISGFSKLVACNLGEPFTEKNIYTAAEFFDLYTIEDVNSAREEVLSNLYEPDFND